MPSLSYGLFFPDVLFSATCVVCYFANRPGAAFLAFLSGLFMGAIVGVSMASTTAIRTLAGYGIGAVAGMDFERNRTFVAIVTATSTVVVQLVTLFVAPKPAIGAFLLATILMAVVNGVLAIPIYALLDRFMDPARR